MKCEDSSPPFFTRFSINSSLIVFKDREWFEDPSLSKSQKAKLSKSLRALEEEKDKYLEHNKVKAAIEVLSVSATLKKEKQKQKSNK